MIVAIAGGSSMSTPALLGEGIPDIEWRLIGRSKSALQANCAVARVLDPHCNASFHVCGPDAAQDALAGAEMVVLQIRVGGFEGRSFDETFPLAFGVCGDEGLGPGGLSAAWRAWPVIEQWLRAIAENAPQATVLMVSSPLGILTRAVSRCFPGLRCFGICEVPFVCLREICEATQTDWTKVEYDYFGVNHIGWLWNLRLEGRDLVREWLRRPNDASFPSREVVAQYGGIPTKYLRLHFHAGDVLREQQLAPESRGEQLQRLSREVRSAYVSGEPDIQRAAVRRRPAPWYRDAIAPFIHSAAHPSLSHDAPFFLTTRNDGWWPALDASIMLEIPFLWRGGALVRKPCTGMVPSMMAEILRRFCHYEDRATRAVIERSADGLTAALEHHPWVPDRKTAVSLSRAIVQRSANGFT